MITSERSGSLSSPTADSLEDSALREQFRAADSIQAAYQIRNALVLRHVDLAADVVRSVVPPALRTHAADARQEACCALVELAASTRPVPQHGPAFRAYLAGAMANRMRAYLARHANPVSGEYPGRRLHRIRRYLRQNGFEAELVSDAQIARGTGLSQVTVRRLRPWLEANVPFHTLDEGGDEPRTRWKFQTEGEGDSSPGAQAESGDQYAQLQELLSTLHWKDQHLIRRVFGLDGGGPASIPEAVAALGISRQRGRMRLRRALAQLRAAWRD